MASFKIGDRYGIPGYGSAWMRGLMAEMRAAGVNPNNYIFKSGGIARFLSGSNHKSFSLGDYKGSFSLGTELPGYKKGWGRQGFVDHQGKESTRMTVGWVVADKRFAKATARAVLRMMETAVHIAKMRHMGWQNRTGNAERSIRIISAPTDKDTYGEWGAGGASHGAIYFPFLEYRYGTLRHARDSVYSGEVLGAYLKQESEALGALVPARQKFNRTPVRWETYKNGRRITTTAEDVGIFDYLGM